MPSALSVLLAVHCKKTDNVDLKTPVHKYISNTYSETEAREAEDDLETIQQLRSTIANASTNGMQPGMRDSLAKWVPSSRACGASLDLLSIYLHQHYREV